MGRFLIGLIGLLFGAWGAAASWFDGPTSRVLASLLGGAVLLTSLAPALAPGRRSVLVAVLSGVGLLGWWWSIPARNDRTWLPDVARPPEVEWQGDRATIHNVRDFVYRSETDFTPRWETRTIDLADVTGLDLYFSFWGSPLIAHTILSWDLRGAPPLAISIETRKEEGESYSPIRGFFRQYELYYVVADERDVIGVRASHRGETLRLYRLRMPPERARRLLRAYLDRVERLAHHPEWYNAFDQNCTTSIRRHVLEIGVPMPLDWRILANGRLDELLYEQGAINTEQPLAALRGASDVTERAKAAAGHPDFWALLRNGLPSRPPPPAP